jgi:hypothetical protein
MADGAADSIKNMSLEDDVPLSADKKPVAIIVIGKMNKVCIH